MFSFNSKVNLGLKCREISLQTTCGLHQNVKSRETWVQTTYVIRALSICQLQVLGRRHVILMSSAHHLQLCIKPTGFLVSFSLLLDQLSTLSKIVSMESDHNERHHKTHDYENMTLRGRVFFGMSVFYWESCRGCYKWSESCSLAWVCLSLRILQMLLQTVW